MLHFFRLDFVFFDFFSVFFSARGLVEVDEVVRLVGVEVVEVVGLQGGEVVKL